MTKKIYAWQGSGDAAMSVAGCLAECRTYRFEFSGSDALYRDHNGHRVLADAEGPGFFKILAAPSDFKIRRDDLICEMKSGSFQSSIEVSCRTPGTSLVSVTRGAAVIADAPPEVTDHFCGCGWIVESQLLNAADGETDFLAGSPQLAPVPVFLSASGKNLKVNRSSFETTLALELDMADSAALKHANWQVKNASKLFELVSVLPKEGKINRQVLSHLNGASFKVSGLSRCSGVLIRKLYDAFHGRQRARVMIDEEFAGWWYEPVEDRVERWRWAHFGRKLDGGKDQVTVSIDPPSGSPLWSVAKYEIYGLVEPD